MGIVKCALAAVAAGTLAAPSSAQALPVQAPRHLSYRKDLHVAFHAPALADGGYYYGVIVLRPYKEYTRESQPPCSSSSDMQRTDYGSPRSDDLVALLLTPANSHTGHWCRGGLYEGAIYAVPHAPPCESSYPCRSEPYEPHTPPCVGLAPNCVHDGVVALPSQWSYPDPLPKPLATGTTIVARFSVRVRSN